MIANKSLVYKTWGISFALAISTAIVKHLSDSSELLLITRLAGSVFFLVIFFKLMGIIATHKKMIKDSQGSIESAFDPTILKLTLFLFIAGWTVYSFMDYMEINYIDWIVIFSAGVILIPISLGLIPLRVKKDKWRRK